MTELVLDTPLAPEQREYLRDRQGLGRLPARRHQRHPGLLQDRGGQAQPRSHRLRPARHLGRHAASCWPCGPTRRAWSWPATSPRRARPAGRRLRAAAADHRQPGGQRHQVHQPGRGGASRGSRSRQQAGRATCCLHFTRRATPASASRPRSCRRSSSRSCRPTARRRASTAAPAWAGHFRPPGRTDGRPDLGRERGRPGQHVPLHARASAVQASAASADAPRRRPRLAAACRCWWWTTTPPAGASSTDMLAGLGPAPTAVGRWPRRPCAELQRARAGRRVLSRWSSIDARMPDDGRLRPGRAAAAARGHAARPILMLSSPDRQRDIVRCRELGSSRT